MVGSDIKNYIEKRLGRSFSDDLILQAINECLDEIADLSLLYVTATLNINDTTQWYALPNNYSQIEKVIKHEDEEEYIYEGWEYRNGTIRIFNKGTFRIVGRKIPDYLEDISNNLSEIHRMYNNAIKYYVLAWVRENEDLDDQISEKYYQKFTEKVQRAASSLISTKSPAKVQVIRRA
jgi:hypothetical protein